MLISSPSSTHDNGDGDSNRNVKSKSKAVISINLELVAIIVHESGHGGGRQEVKTKNSVALSGVEVKAKTKWAYTPIPVPQPSSASQPVTLPNYLSSAEEPLFLFLEVWKKGNFHGLCECNLRHLVDSNDSANNMIKWLPIYNPVWNQVVGKALLSLDVGVSITEVKKPISSAASESANQQTTSRAITPISAYFPLSNQISPDSTSAAFPPPSTSNSTVITNKSSPVHSEGSHPSTQGSIDLTDVDIIEILNGKLDSLNQSLQKSKTIQFNQKPINDKTPSQIPKPKSTSSSRSQDQSNIVGCTKVKKPIVVSVELNSKFPKKKRTMAAAVGKFRDPPPSTT